MEECVSCGGRYERFQLDSGEYFHVCPPLSPTELAAAVAKGLVTLTPTQLADASSGRVFVRRPLARNENVPSSDPAASGLIIAAGLGTVDVAIDVGVLEVSL